MINLKKEIFKLGLGIGYIIILLFIIKYFSLNYVYIYLLLLVTGTLIGIKQLTIKKFIINAITLAVVMAVIYYLSIWIGGIWGFIITTGLICIFLLYTRRKRFIEVKQHIESLIWGKPLKEFIEKGEKPPKIELRG